MAASETTSALRQKLCRDAADGRERSRTALRALRLALARVSRETLDLRMDVIGATQSSLPQEELAPLLPDDQLLIVLDGPGGATGALALDRAAVVALTQKQTTGAVRGDAASERAFTDTDAAMCAPLAEAMLAAASDLAGQPRDRACLAGYRFGARADDGRSLALSMSGDLFRAFELRLDIEAGTLQSSLTLVLPDVAEGARRGADGTGSGGHGAGDGMPNPTLADAALNAPVPLNAVLCRMRLGLDRLTSLKAGDVLPLGGYRIDRTELLSASGHAVGFGRLGRVDGLRAVRVNETTTPDAAFSLSERERQEGLPKLPAAPAGRALHVRADEAEQLDHMDPDEAMARISELAGLETEAEVSDPAPVSLDPAPISLDPMPMAPLPDASDTDPGAAP